MPFCIALPLSLSLSPSPATPLNTEYLSTKTKQKRQYESFEPQWHRSLYRVRTRRVAVPVQNHVGRFFFLFFLMYQMGRYTGGSACSSRAKSMDYVKYQTRSKKPTDVTIMEEFWQWSSYLVGQYAASLVDLKFGIVWLHWQNSFIQTSGRTYIGQKRVKQYSRPVMNEMGLRHSSVKKKKKLVKKFRLASKALLKAPWSIFP